MVALTIHVVCAVDVDPRGIVAKRTDRSLIAIGT
jgi:hypothetical protein